MLTLDLALITYGADGIGRVAAMNLPRVDGVRYVVSWQQHGDTPVPQTLVRDDVAIHRLDIKGQSHNRNNAVNHCSGDIILMSDDDLIYTAEGLKAVISTYEQNPDIDVATFRSAYPYHKPFPSAECILSDPLPKNYSVATFEISCRRRSIGDLRFHPLFGLNSPAMHGAEDEFFLLSAIRRGLDCRFFPITICKHPTLTTGVKHRLTDCNLRAIGCYIALAYRRTWPARILLKALRTKRSRQAGLFRALRYLAAGALYAPTILKGDRRYLW